MELKEFLSNTLTEIVKGVNEANNELNTKQFVIYNKPENSIEFDVAVIVSEGKTEVAEGSFGAGIGSFFAKIGANRKRYKSDKHVSRIKFRVKPREKIE